MLLWSVYLYSQRKSKCWLKATIIIFIFQSYYDIYRHESDTFITSVTYFFYNLTCSGFLFILCTNGSWYLVTWWNQGMILILIILWFSETLADMDTYIYIYIYDTWHCLPSYLMYWLMHDSSSGVVLLMRCHGRNK